MDEIDGATFSMTRLLLVGLVVSLGGCATQPKSYAYQYVGGQLISDIGGLSFVPFQRVLGEVHPGGGNE